MNNSKALMGSYGEDEMVICLNSGLSSSKQWFGLMNELDNSNWFSLTDQFGRINSKAVRAKDEISLEDEAQSIAELVDTQNKKVHLVGHSFGAAVALNVAQIGP